MPLYRRYKYERSVNSARLPAGTSMRTSLVRVPTFVVDQIAQIDASITRSAHKSNVWTVGLVEEDTESGVAVIEATLPMPLSASEIFVRCLEGMEGLTNDAGTLTVTCAKFDTFKIVLRVTHTIPRADADSAADADAPQPRKWASVFGGRRCTDFVVTVVSGLVLWGIIAALSLWLGGGQQPLAFDAPAAAGTGSAHDDAATPPRASDASVQVQAPAPPPTANIDADADTDAAPGFFRIRV